METQTNTLEDEIKKNTISSTIGKLFPIGIVIAGFVGYSIGSRPNEKPLDSHTQNIQSIAKSIQSDYTGESCELMKDYLGHTKPMYSQAMEKPGSHFDKKYEIKKTAKELGLELKL